MKIEQTLSYPLTGVLAIGVLFLIAVLIRGEFFASNFQQRQGVTRQIYTRQIKKGKI